MKSVKTIIMITCILLLPITASAEENKEELKAIEIMATRTSIKEENQSTAITVITQEEIQQKQHMQVKDILREQLGINVVTVGPLGGTSTVFMRGANSQSTLVMIDGVQVNANTTGGFDFSNLQMDNIDRIEILRGIQSTLWGADAVGGVINIITKRGKGKPTHSLAFEGGSFATFKETLASSGTIQNFDYSLSASQTNSDGFSSASEEQGATENDGFGNTTLSSRLGMDFLDDGRIDFIGRYVKTRHDFDSFGPTDSIPETAILESFSVAVPIQKSITSWWDTRINTNFNYEDSEFPTFNSRVLNRTYTVDFQNNLELSQFFSAVLGYEYQVTNGSNRGNNFSFDNRSQGIYLQGNFNYKDTAFLTAGIRENINSEFDDQLTYKVEGALVSKESGTKFRASYATGFRVPTINNLFFPGFSNPNLRPEESKNWELGLEQKLLQDKLTLGVSYFNTNYDDLIQSSGFPLFIPLNIASAESQGIESFIKYNMTDNMDLTANYTWNEAVDTTNQSLQRRPRGTATGTLHYIWDKKLDSVITVQYRSGMISGSGRVGGRTLVRAALSYKIDENWKLTARGENLLDKNYEESVGFGTAGISGYAGFAYTF